MIRRVMLLFFFLPALALALAGSTGAASWELGEFPREFTLDNGLRVILQRDLAAPITVVQLLVRGGDRDDPEGKAGLAYLTARLCLEVTRQIMLQQLVDLGSSFSLDVGGDYALVTIRSLSRHLDPTLNVLVGMMSEPLFSDLRVDGIKEFMRSLRKQEHDNAVTLMRKTVAASFFAVPVYGAALFGSEGSLRAIGKKDIQDFFRAHYVTGNMVAVVASDLGEEELRPLLARRLGCFAAGPRLESPPLATSCPKPMNLALRRQAAQALVSISVALPPLTADDLALATLLESWLGKGIGSRLWSLRSREGLAYGLGAELQPNRCGMLLSVYLKTDERRLAAAQAELERLLRDVHQQGIVSSELAAAKAYACSVFWRENESRERRAAFLAFLEGAGLSWPLAGDFTERLKRISLEEFNGRLRDWLAPERWFGLQIGPENGPEQQ